MYASSRKNLIAACAATIGLTAPDTALAQGEDYERIVTIMRACSQIEDMAARVTCYDNNIGVGRTQASPTGSGGVPPSSARPSAPAGFGAETLPQERERREAQQDDAVDVQLAAIERAEPGIYVITLADGAQWRFVDSAGMAYELPRSGDRIRLERGALGSFRMLYNGQRGLRVRRIR